MPTPETFDSEIGDVHERGRPPRSTFADEFRGAPPSVIADERPPDMLAHGRRGRRLVWVLILVAGLIGGAAWAVYYWWEDLQALVAGAGEDEDEDDTSEGEEDEAAADTTGGETGTEEGPVRPLGLPMGVPDEAGDEPAADEGGEPQAEPGEAPEPPEPETPEPKAGEAKVEVLGTSIRGKVSNSAVRSRLAKVDEALEGCWAEAVKAGADKPAELKLSFQIKWNRRTQGVSVSGAGVPSSVQSCARKALPSGGWPEPRDYGKVSVTRRWSLKLD